MAGHEILVTFALLPPQSEVAVQGYGMPAKFDREVEHGHRVRAAAQGNPDFRVV